MENIGNHEHAKGFIIKLPFEYKKAVLTQERTSRNKPYAFIVEFHDGSRKFMKGPYKSAELAQGHVICNEVKRSLESKYLHPVQCEVKEYCAHSVFLECEELGKADLSKVGTKPSKLEDDTFEVLQDSSNDVISDPFDVLTEINDENQRIWIEIMVNYCFRWVFGIGDAARRNLMLQRSTGKIYSVDETGIEYVSHENVWGGKRPNKKVFKLIKAFLTSGLSHEVLIEVKRWKMSLDLINCEVVFLSKDVERRTDELLDNPGKVFDI